MLNASTLAALHQICTNVHLSVDVQELSTLLTVLGVLPQEEQKQVTWAAIGMAITNANRNTVCGGNAG